MRAKNAWKPKLRCQPSLIYSIIDTSQANLHKKSKNANEPVTDGDLLSHRAMNLGLTKAFPGITVVSEERETSDDKKFV